MESLKIITETNITTNYTTTIEEKYKVVAPEAMHETFMSDSEDEGGKYLCKEYTMCFRYMVCLSKKQRFLKLLLSCNSSTLSLKMCHDYE